jgi:DNA ligase (NAD+)
MDIQGVGPAIIDELVDLGKLKTPADLYKLQEKDLKIPGLIADTKAKAILDEIEKSKERPYERVLSSLGIDFVSTTTAKDLSDMFMSIESLCNATREQLTSVNGIAAITADAIYESLHSVKKQLLIKDLTEAGLKMSAETKECLGAQLVDKIFCITGTLSRSRDEFKQLIEAHGGRVVGTVSSKTTYLLAGAGGGSKEDKAKKLKIPIISEEQLKEMLL